MVEAKKLLGKLYQFRIVLLIAVLLILFSSLSRDFFSLRTLEQTLQNILAHEVEAGEHPTYWMRLEEYGWDVEIPRDDAPEEEKTAAAERRKLAFADLLEELKDARETDGDEEAEGRIRSAPEVPMSLTMQAFQTFMEAGYDTVEMEARAGKPPGPIGDR